MIRPRILVAAAFSALAACATVEEPAVQPDAEEPEQMESPAAVARITPAPRSAPVQPQSSKVSEVELLLTDFERLRRLPTSEVLREQEAARQAFNQSRSDAARVRLAMTLGLPGQAGGEDLRALELLDPLVRNPMAGLHGLAFLMSAYIQEQRRLASQLVGAQQNVQGLQQNVQSLQQKLDALRTLERSLTEREPPRRR